MSYDLMVFDPVSAPTSHDEFMEWYRRQTEWSEGHAYDDPAVCALNLQAWFTDIIERFPSLNGPQSLSDDDFPEDEEAVTDYSVGKTMIYCAFSSSKSEQALELVLDLCEKHNLGVFNASSDKELVWLPRHGMLVLAHSKL